MTWMCSYIGVLLFHTHKSTSPLTKTKHFMCSVLRTEMAIHSPKPDIYTYYCLFHSMHKQQGP